MRRNASNSAYYQPIFAYLSCKYSIKTAFPIRLPNYSTGNYGIFSEKRLSISEIKYFLYLLHRRSLDTLLPIAPWCVANRSMVCCQSLHGVLGGSPWWTTRYRLPFQPSPLYLPPLTTCSSAHHNMVFHPIWRVPPLAKAGLPSTKATGVLTREQPPPLTGTFFLRTENY